jgi:prepilin-type N-terminal cleavage/methylation domain-containing protein
MLVALHRGVRRLQSNRGYSLIEVMAAMAVLGVLGAMAVPMVSSASSGVKLRDHANAIADLIGLAKLRATAEFTRSRLYVDLAAESYVIQIWDEDAGAWVDERAAVELPTGISFGWGDLDEAPPKTQDGDELKFAAECVDADEEIIEKTACIMFNSRGIPIDKDRSPVGGNAFYLTDGTGVRGVTVTATPLVRRWWSSAANASWVPE